MLLIQIAQLKDSLSDSEDRIAVLNNQLDNYEKSKDSDMSQLQASFKTQMEMQELRHSKELEQQRVNFKDILAHVKADAAETIEQNNKSCQAKLQAMDDKKVRAEEALETEKMTITDLQKDNHRLVAFAAKNTGANLYLRQHHYGASTEQARLLSNRNPLTRVEEKELFMKCHPEAVADQDVSCLNTKRRDRKLNKQLRMNYAKNQPYTSTPAYKRWEDYVKLQEGESLKKRNGIVEKRIWHIVRMIPAHFEEEFVEVVTIRSKGKEDRNSLPKETRAVPGVPFCSEAISFILTEHFCFNTTWANIARKLSYYGLNISDSTLGDIAHRCIRYIKKEMEDTWVAELYKTGYWMIDETVAKVATCDEKTGKKTYHSKYMWGIRANALKLSWFIYENGSRGAKVIKPYLDKFKGFFTTDGYIAYKIYEKIEKAPQKRCACLTHIRRYFVDALYESKRLMSWFINKFRMLFEIEAECKESGLEGDARKQKRIEKSSTILQEIQDKFGLVMAAGIDKLGNATKSALNYIKKEWKAMKRIIDSGEAEISNNLCEQMMRHIKINLRNSQNIGSEKCAKDFCFMYSLIESCGFNQLSPMEYISALLRRLPTITTGKERRDMLPCYYKNQK